MYINYDKFAAAKLIHAPFDHLVMTDFLNKSQVDLLIQDFPKINVPGSMPLESLEYGPHFKGLLQELNGIKFRKLVEQKFSIPLGNEDSCIS